MEKRGVEVGLDVEGRGLHGNVERRHRRDLYRSAKEGPQYMAYAQPHPRLSVVSTSSQSSADHLSPTTTSTRFSLPSTNKAGPNRPNIYDRNLNKTRASEVSASAFAFLFSEIVQYTQKRVSGINDLERQ